MLTTKVPNGKVKGYNLNIHDCILYLATPPIPLPAKTIKISLKELFIVYVMQLEIWIEGVFKIDKPCIVLQNNFYFTTHFIIRVLIVDNVCRIIKGSVFINDD